MVVGRSRSVVALLVLAAAGEHRRAGAVPGLTGRLSRLAGSISNSVLEGLDPDLIVDRIDVDALVDRIDVADVVARIDPDEIVARTDVNALLDRVDVDRLLDRVDVDRLLDRVDVDRLLDRVDVDRLVERVDLEALVRRAGIPEIVAESTGHVAGSALDLVRQQAVALDLIVMQALLRVLRRDPERLPAGPSGLVGKATGLVTPPDPDAPRVRARYEVTGHYAGLLSRLGAQALDIAAATASFTAVSAGLAFVFGVLFGVEVGATVRVGSAWIGGLIAWMFLYWWLSTAIAGRTPAMLLLGLRIVARDGSPLRNRPALVRTLVLAVSTLPFGVGFVGVVLDRERRALHDLAAHSAVVYDWGDSAAQLPTPLGRWLSRHDVPGPAAHPGDDHVTR